MAIGSAIIGKIKGHAGNLVFRVRKGEQVIQTKPGPRGKDHLPTYNQAWNYMRFKWASLMSQVTLELTDHSFTRKYMKQSSTNKFIQANIQNFIPINKKCQNMYDTSVEAFLAFNGIQMSTGDMPPVEIELGVDFSAIEDTSAYDAKVSFPWLKRFKGVPSANMKIQTILSDELVMEDALTWARAKGLQPGEMLTLVIMTASSTQTPSWFNDGVLYGGLTMGFIRFKLDADDETFIIEVSNGLNQMDAENTIQAAPEGDNATAEFKLIERWVVGACIIHSKEIYGGWSCDDTTMKLIDPVTGNFVKNWTFEQNARTLYLNDWSTQDMPILDPASLTSEQQNNLYSGRVVTTISATGNRVIARQIGKTEEVTISGEDLEVSEKTQKKRSSKNSEE